MCKEVELKPCPFCGADAKAVMQSKHGEKIFGYCRCTKCGISQDQYEEGNLREAMCRWNRRV